MPPRPKTPDSRGNLKSLQILRAIAAISVVYSHVAVAPKFGAFGVDIFFVISGFVMALVIANGESPRAFAIGRLARIVPLYWIMTTCILLVIVAKPTLFTNTTATIANYVRSMLFIPYFKENGEMFPLLFVGWSLNYEMLFYLCIWISIVVARGIYAPLTLALLGAIYFFGLGSENSLVHSFFGSDYLFEFAFGLVAYQAYSRINFASLGVVSLLALSFASYSFMAYVQSNDFAVIRPLAYGIPSVVLLISFTALEKVHFSKQISLINFLASLGDDSYAIYLSHVYVVEGTRRILFQKFHFINPYTPWGVLSIIGVSLIAGHIIYIVFDRPISKQLKKTLLRATSKSIAVVKSAEKSNLNPLDGRER